MPGKLELFQKTDNLFLIRDAIAAILKVETESLAGLAKAAEVDPAPFQMQVYKERSAPWQKWLRAGEDKHPVDYRPIVSVRTHRNVPDRSKSAHISPHHGRGEYLIDVYGYGIAENVPGGGHKTGDEESALACHTAYQTVRNILMSDVYHALGFSGVAIDRWIAEVAFGNPGQNGTLVQNVTVGQARLEVDFDEHAPEFKGEILSEIAGEVTNGPDGEVVLAMTHPVPAP